MEIKISEKKSYKVQKNHNLSRITAIEHLFKGSVKAHILIDDAQADEAIASIEATGNWKEVTNRFGCEVFMGKA